jgi:uncharacterized membrane protein YphA (DoxX/SURF4 family)
MTLLGAVLIGTFVFAAVVLIGFIVFANVLIHRSGDRDRHDVPPSPPRR